MEFRILHQECWRFYFNYPCVKNNLRSNGHLGVRTGRAPL